MRWEDERYVRVYTRDTPDWLCLSFLAQGLFCLILRKVDRAGLLKLGKHGRKAVAIVIGFPGDWTRLEPALDELLADGCVRIRGDFLVVPNFIEAQDATQSDAQRKRESRARSRDIAAAADVLNTDKTSESVTESHETGQKVTSGHGASQVVTPNCAVPSRAVPNQPNHIRSSIVPDHRDGSPEEIFHSLFKQHPAWTAVRRCLTTEQAYALDAEALQFCGAVVRGEEAPDRDRVAAIIQAHAARKATA